MMEWRNFPIKWTWKRFISCKESNISLRTITKDLGKSCAVSLNVLNFIKSKDVKNSFKNKIIYRDTD